MVILHSLTVSLSVICYVYSYLARALYLFNRHSKSLTASTSCALVMDHSIPPDREDAESSVDGFNIKLRNYVKRIVSLPDVRNGELQPGTTAGGMWQQCCICYEPFEYHTWTRGLPVHRPIKLCCGHVFGMPCLARWASEVEFSNHCPFCRSAVYRHRTAVVRDHAPRRLAIAIAQIQNACENHLYHIWCNRKDYHSRRARRRLCNRLRQTESSLSTERTMAIFEAMVDVWWQRI